MDFFMGRWKTIVGETDESQQNPADTVCRKLVFLFLEKVVLIVCKKKLGLNCPSHQFFFKLDHI